MPGGGKSESVATSQHLGGFGTVPVGGVRVLVICIKNRGDGFSLMIMTDEAVVVIDIP